MSDLKEKIEDERRSLVLRVKQLGERGGTATRHWPRDNWKDFWAFYYSALTTRDMIREGWTEAAHFELKKLRRAAEKLGVVI